MLRNKVFKALILVLVMVFLTSSVVTAVPVQTETVFEDIDVQNILGHISVLSEDIGIRTAGSDGEKAAADYIQEVLEGYGLEVEQTPFLATVFSYGDLYLKNITDNYDFPAGPENPETLVVEFCGSTNGTLSSKLVYAGLGYDEDFINLANAGNSAEGKIALIKRGDLFFYEKIENAIEAKAAGVILFNRDDEPGFINATLGNPYEIPAVEILPEVGRSLEARLSSGEAIEFEMRVTTEVEVKPSQNVMATLKADKQKEDTPTIVVGAHYDGVECPAANDNASGVATMLEAARVLKDYNLAANIKFMAFGAEEVGLVGSYEYVESLSKQDLKKIAAMINLDMVGVGDQLAIYKESEGAKPFVADLVEKYLEQFGIDHLTGVNTQSDHVPFAEYGLSSVYLNYETDPYYHTVSDTIDKINPENIGNVCKVVTAMTYDMSRTPMPQSDEGYKGRLSQYKNIKPGANIE